MTLYDDGVSVMIFQAATFSYQSFKQAGPPFLGVKFAIAYINFKPCVHLTQGVNESANFRFLQRFSVIFGFHRDGPRSVASCRNYHPRKMAFCRDCLCDSASCRDSRQEAKSHEQSLQEAIY